MKILTVASDSMHPGCMQLKRSLEYFGYQYHIIQKPFQFGRQMQHVYQWAKSNPGWFLYTDAYDTFALGGLNRVAVEFEALTMGVVTEVNPGLKPISMIISTEKACYPIASMASQYPECRTEWKYVNGGGFMADAAYFCEIFEDGTHHKETNDQVWLAEQYLKRQDRILLNTSCNIFQSIAFEGPDDFSTEEVPQGYSRLINKKTGTHPVFIHGNGHTDMSKIYKLLP
jgi:hypothetical protein